MWNSCYTLEEIFGSLAHSSAVSVGAMDRLRKELKVLRQKQRRLARRMPVSKKQRCVAVSIYVLDGYNAQAAAEYVRQRSLTSNLLACDAAYHVEQWFLGMTVPELTSLNFPDSEAQQKVWDSAVKFLAEFRTVRFIEKCNFQQGHAPTSSEAASNYVRNLRELGAEALGESLKKSLDAGSRWARRWVQLWRKRWNLSMRVLKTHGVSMDDLNTKASYFGSALLVRSFDLLTPIPSDLCRKHRFRQKARACVLGKPYQNHQRESDFSLAEEDFCVQLESCVRGFVAVVIVSHPGLRCLRGQFMGPKLGPLEGSKSTPNLGPKRELHHIGHFAYELADWAQGSHFRPIFGSQNRVRKLGGMCLVLLGKT